MKYCPECATKLERTVVDGIERLVCSLPICNFINWDNPIPVVAGLVQYDDNFILARNVKWPDGTFSLITGFLERNESPEQAICREVKEELNLDVETMEFIGHYPFFETNQLVIAYWLTARGNVNLGCEITEIRILARPELVNFDFGDFLLISRLVKEFFSRTGS